MPIFQVKVFHRSSKSNVDRAWQPTDEPVAPVHTEAFDAQSREVAELMLQKKYPRYTPDYGYSLDVQKIY